MARRLERRVAQGVGLGLVARSFGNRDVAVVLLLDKEAGTVPALLPVLLGQVAVELIGAALGHDGDLRAAGVADGRIEVDRVDTVLLDGG